MKKFLIIVFLSMLLPFFSLSAEEKSLVDFYTEACEEGNYLICMRLGDMYFTGKDAQNNWILSQFIYEKAFAILKDKCKSGSSSDCFALGVLYEIGKGIEKNIEEAAFIFHELCNKGDCLGCNNIIRLKEERSVSQESQYLLCSEKVYQY